MNFSKYTTQEIEFIISNFDDLKRELEKRNIKESDNFIFKIGDVIYRKCDSYNLLLKIKKIDNSNNCVIADKIIIREYASFDVYVDNWFDIDRTEWHEYVKIEDSQIFENLLNIIDEYDNDLLQLNDYTYLRLKNQIAPYDN